MSDSKAVIVKILDKDYQIACKPEEREELHAAASELDERMRIIRNTGSVVGLDRIAVMAALNLCHELHQLQHNNSNAKEEKDLDADTLNRLRNKIDKALLHAQKAVE